ncbi:MAG: RDD family protein [Sulfurimicrobium sp.]|nr:RDD family protein [Sulfurimicrobium sp.]MDP1704033.1 RDD family protein [Sulfurimicrobium sp.]MDP2197421.1 RDD family protein [Sulfurimicrobium sp.]MDP2961739.1 RDD family protein [Sulfurimicrobium sp.]MDP3688501.1 RDD family protein [Sulfurimicrobium sp.]
MCCLPHQPSNFKLLVENSPVNLTHPGILRRLASMLYESLLLVAVLFLAGFLFAGLTLGSTMPLVRVVFQIYLLGVVAAYFIWFWLRGGQTLAMKTWHLRLVSADGAPLTRRRAILRFALALPSTLLGIGILWALFDRERLFLHDRLAKTKIILTADR